MNRQELEEKIKSVQDERERRFNAGENIRHFEEELVALKTELAELRIAEAKQSIIKSVLREKKEAPVKKAGRKKKERR